VTSAASQKGVALCVIDGTRSIFSPNYITQGQEGGRGAGREIIRGITDHLVHRSIQDMNPKLAIIVYVRKAQLQHDLVGSNNCTSEQFDDFFVGLNETPYINIVEVSSKRDADKKIEEHLQLFAGLTQTVRIFFSGGNGSEYLSIIPTLDKCSATSKLVILRSYSGPSISTSARIPSLMLPGLFMKYIPAGQLIPATPHAPTSPSPFPLAEADETDVRTPSPKSFTSFTFFNNAQRRQTVIDPNLPLYKQNPPPCNEYYLMQSCSKEGRCRMQSSLLAGS